jgi:uncharacterized membrane protein SpoIIM required for sporulation/uncharacterized RDD family membrane protein YckC
VAPPRRNPSEPVHAPAAELGLDAERSARLWTPERVPLTVPLAGLGERALAYLVDVSLLVVLLFAGLFVYNSLWGDFTRDFAALSTLGTVLVLLALFGGAALYDVLWEVLAGGRTPGKRLLKLRVLQASGRSPELFTSLLRNLIRIIDVLPVGYGVGTVTMFFTGTRRLGDLVADTFVVTERSRRRDPLAACRAALGVGQAVGRARGWSDAQQSRALGIVERTVHLEAKTASALCSRALSALDAELAAGTGPAEARAVIASQCLLHAGTGAGVLAQITRLVEAEAALQAALGKLRRGASFADVEEVDRAIRRAASELMRGERRGVPARHLESLSLALLDAERRRAVRLPPALAVRRFLFSEVPATVWAERGLVARAGAVLVLGLFIGGGVSYADAGLARALVGDEVAAMVEQGATWTDRIEESNAFAQTSVKIILNNIGVGVRVFALGLLGGVATLLGLLSNGVQIGAVFGYALRLGTADTLLRFILAHGPVELTMICVAGAAGMCLGRALLAPGRRTRLQALREEGARGVRLIVAASLGFLVIGAVEGFVSPGRLFPAVVNASIGLTLLALFWGWVLAWGRPTRAS